MEKILPPIFPSQTHLHPDLKIPLLHQSASQQSHQQISHAHHQDLHIGPVHGNEYISVTTQQRQSPLTNPNMSRHINERSVIF